MSNWKQLLPNWKKLLGITKQIQPDARKGRPFLKFLLLFALCSVVAQYSWAQARKGGDKEPLTRILFIFDGSASMNGVWEKNKQKFTVASELLRQSVDSLNDVDNVQMALRVYGHQKYYGKGQDCDDTKLEVPFGRKNGPKIKSSLGSIKPKGTTPIALTLEKSANDFPPCANCRNIIILITDGQEECDGDPCAVSLALQKKGIILKPFIIGVGLDVEFRDTFECMGSYYDATNPESFQNILRIVISQALNSTTAQVNLIDEAGNPTETNVNMTFYDQHIGSIHYNMIHTMNHYGNPDTLSLDPIPTYRLVVHTIPPVSKDSIIITGGIHNVIGVDAPQGYLKLKMLGINERERPKTIVRLAGEMKTLHIQDFNTDEKYLTGNYDIEVLTLPRTYIKDVEIKQSHTTTVEIPQPGLVSMSSLSKGFGGIYLQNGTELEWVCNLPTEENKHNLNLQPGNYLVVFRPKSAKETIFTVKKKFKVSSGTSVAVQLY